MTKPDLWDSADVTSANGARNVSRAGLDSLNRILNILKTKDGRFAFELPDYDVNPNRRVFNYDLVGIC